MIMYVCFSDRFAHWEEYVCDNFDAYIRSPHWIKMNILDVSSEIIFEHRCLVLTRRLASGDITHETIRPYHNKLYDSVARIFYNGKLHILNTDDDVLECYEELCILMNNERMEKVLATV